MSDVLTPEQRSYNMSRIRGRDTKPEMVVRRLVHGLGFRYRLHVSALPGKPDLVFPSRHKIIFVHGCYWHRHKCRFGRVVPSTNKEFWLNKFNRNIECDRRAMKLLKKKGWDVLVIWECQVDKIEILRSIIINFLGFSCKDK